MFFQSSYTSSWTSFLKSIATFKGDLASLTAPPFILSPFSLTEYCKFWANNQSDFVAIAKEQDPEKRFLAVVRWFVGTLKEQYYSRNEKLGFEKKPLNPFLGEVFAAQWESKENGNTGMVTEQVSHHPPVTAFNIWNEQNGVNLEGYVGVKASLSTHAISVRQYGHSILTLEGFGDEQYMITLPALHLEGILFCRPYVELDGKSFIQSSTGFKATFEYSGKGYFTGKKNSFKATIVKNSEPKEILYSLKGQWSGMSTICCGKPSSSVNETVFMDSQTLEVLELQVKDVCEQSRFETRRAWRKVAEAIMEQDFQLIHHEKSKIEAKQRVLRKREERDGKVWPRRWFEAVNVVDEPWYTDLCSSAGVVAGPSQSSSIETKNQCLGDTGSNWRFSKKRYLAGPIRTDVNIDLNDDIEEYLELLEREGPVAGEEEILKEQPVVDGLA